MTSTVAMREGYRDWYLRERDPIPDERLAWRAQLFRQLVHLLPGESILDLGSGDGAFSHKLEDVARSQSQVTRLSFANPRKSDTDAGSLEVESFDHVVAFDVIDSRDDGETLALAFRVLKPGGRVVLFATNPGNPVLRIRRAWQRARGNADPRGLLTPLDIVQGLSAAGFANVEFLYTDFLYAPLNSRGTRLFHGMSAILQNLRGVKTMSGSAVIYAEKPGRKSDPPPVNLADRPGLSGKVSVVVPCHNEEMNVRPLVARLLAHFSSYLHEVILVEDNSTDGTRDVIADLMNSDSRIKILVRRPPGGVGYALRDGYRAATGEYILSLDADFQHLIPELRDLFDAAADGADVVVGSRFAPDSLLLNYPVQKIIANRAFHLLASLALRSRFRDLTNNLKLMKAEVAKELTFDEPGFAVNAETGLAPVALGYTVVEVPISWVGRAAEMGVSSFRLAGAGPGYLRVLKRLRSGKRRPRPVQAP
jgi:dolichol-phosphate mannosyltransferase